MTYSFSYLEPVCFSTSSSNCDDIVLVKKPTDQIQEEPMFQSESKGRKRLMFQLKKSDRKRSILIVRMLALLFDPRLQLIG